MAGIHRGRRLSDAVALAFGRLGHCASGRLARAWLLATEGWRLARHDARRPKNRRSVSPGAACQLLRGRCLRALCRQAFAERGGMGGGSARWPSGRRLRQRLAMDPQRLSALPALPRTRRRAWARKREIHGESEGAARLLASNAGRPRARELSQFFLSAGALAVQWAATRGV